MDIEIQSNPIEHEIESNNIETEANMSRIREKNHANLTNLDYEHSAHTGFQSEINSNNKLSSDLVYDTNQTNKFVTSQEKQTWNNKSDFSGDYNDLSNKPDLSEFITKDVDNLTNYTKTNNMNTAISNAVGTETTNRQNADINLQGQIDAITASSDVVDIVATYSDLQNYDTSDLTADDVIKVMQDSTHSNALSYFRWVITGGTGAWEYIGSEGPFYTKSETDTLLNDKVGFTDYATNAKGGVVKTYPYAGFEVYNGYPYAGTKTYSNYNSSSNDLFIGKGTLENVITGKGLVKDTDYATNNKGGVFKTSSVPGTYIDNGVLYPYIREYNSYQRDSDTLFISKGTLERVITGKELTNKTDSDKKLDTKDSVSMFSNAVYDEVEPSKNFEINSAYSYFGRKLIQDKLEYDLQLLGESTQDSTTGKQLFNKDNPGLAYRASASTLEKGVRITGTDTVPSAYVAYKIGESELLGETITLYSEMTASSTNLPACRLFYGTDARPYDVAINQMLHSGSLTVTIDNSFPGSNTGVYLLVYSSYNNTQAIGDYVDYTNLIVKKGSTASASDYEEFTGGQPSPSPSYSQEIKSIKAKNLFNINNITCYYNATYNSIATSSGSISNGIITSQLGLAGDLRFLYDSSITLKAGTYTLSTYAKANKNSGNKGISMAVYKKNNISSIASKTQTLAEYNVEERASLTFTLNEETEIIISLQGLGQSGDYTNLNIEFYKVQLNEGSQALPYRPYGCIGIESEGRNKFKPISNTIINGVTLTYNSDGSYTLNGTSTSSFNFDLSNQNLKAGDYTIQCKYEGALPSNSDARAQVYSSSQNFNAKINNNADNTAISNKTLSSDVTDVSFRIRVENGFSYNNVKLYPLFVKGTYTSSTMPEFKSYVKNTVYIPLLHDMRSDKQKTARDTYEKIGDTWYDIQRIFEKILNGSENWTLDTTKEITQVFALTNGLPDMSTSNMHCISNYFIDNAVGDVEKIVIGARNIYIAINKTTASTVEEFKTWLSTHNTEVCYILQEPIITEITDTATIEALETIRTYTGLTEITSDIDITGSYVEDINKATDLTDYVKNTDYATGSKGGVIKLSGYGAMVNANGAMYAGAYNFSEYQNLGNTVFMSKGTFENVLTGKGVLDSSKVKTTTDTTAGNVYDVTYINTMLGNIESLLSEV